MIPFIVLLLLFVSICFSQTFPSLDNKLEIIRQNVFYLASDSIGGRVSGTVGSHQAYDFLANQFKNIQSKYQTNLTTQNFQYEIN
ncbi:MAG: hypothetical protein NZ108_02100, partial [Bacteroidia bacterium]|nr:hypothetical protein [Bacteroidia bacterium]